MVGKNGFSDIKKFTFSPKITSGQEVSFLNVYNPSQVKDQLETRPSLCTIGFPFKLLHALVASIISLCVKYISIDNPIAIIMAREEIIITTCLFKLKLTLFLHSLLKQQQLCYMNNANSK